MEILHTAVTGYSLTAIEVNPSTKPARGGANFERLFLIKGCAFALIFLKQVSPPA